ncbi:HipA domain-containing protein [Emticicia sp. W12TSBA100-4]|uniref:HipA domain-containing protein n=1 Tax=Emticicia sp. W12TSBA100-4 TaxID=3160965 RepID=UPI003305721A
MSRCLYCYQPLENQEIDFHKKCSKHFFGVNQAPILNFGVEELKLMAQKAIVQRMTVTGVQPKLSLSLEKVDATHNRLTIVGLWGDYILKPPTEHFPQLPENEDLTMKLAALYGIRTAEHSLIRLSSGELAYLTKRFDRQNGQKIHVEDLCQLTGTLTEHKYRGSMEKVGKAIKTFSTNTGLDALSFFELSIFCFLTSNADMHLKNFSLMKTPTGEIQLTPAYDLVSTKLAMPQDLEEMALTINGKKNRLKKIDFDKLGESLGISPKAMERVYQKFANKKESMKKMIHESFLSQSLADEYLNLVVERERKIETK